MKYYVVSIFYEEQGVIKKPLRKSYLLEMEDFPKLWHWFESEEYEIPGYRKVGFTNLIEVSKETFDALKILDSRGAKTKKVEPIPILVPIRVEWKEDTSA